MMLMQKQFTPSYKRDRHGRLFELIRQADTTLQHVKDTVVDDAAMLAFRDMAVGSLYR